MLDTEKVMLFVVSFKVKFPESIILPSTFSAAVASTSLALSLLEIIDVVHNEINKMPNTFFFIFRCV